MARQLGKASGSRQISPMKGETREGYRERQNARLGKSEGSRLWSLVDEWGGSEGNLLFHNRLSAVQLTAQALVVLDGVPADSQDSAMELYPATSAEVAQLEDGRSSGVVRVEDGKAVAPLSLQTNFTDKGDVREEGDDVLLSSHWVQVAQVDGSVVRGSRSYDLLVAHWHRCRSLVECRGATASWTGGVLLVGPVDSQGSRAQPLAVESPV